MVMEPLNPKQAQVAATMPATSHPACPSKKLVRSLRTNGLRTQWVFPLEKNSVLNSTHGCIDACHVICILDPQKNFRAQQHTWLQ